MLRQLLSESEWQDVREFVSPKIFRVVPISVATRQFRRIVSNYFNRHGFDKAIAQRQSWLDEKNLPLKLSRKRSVALGDGALGGNRVLELYFHQLFYGRTTLLDLRHDRFGGLNGKIEWVPQAFWIEWERDFLQAARDLYLGFFLEQDERFDNAMRTMGLSCAEDVFLDHFGGGEQQEVSFRLQNFVQTFRGTLRECKRAGEKAHPNLIPFGMYIVTLYDHLEALGGTYDVREAFFSAVDVDDFQV